MECTAECELRETERQVVMDATISDRKQLMENAVMHRQPVQLSESGGDVITFSLLRHDPSSCVRYGLCACNH